MNEPNLDFDDDLDADAEIFGLQKISSLQTESESNNDNFTLPPVLEQPPFVDLVHTAVLMARESWGLLPVRFAQEFYEFTSAFINSDFQVDFQVAEKLVTQLRLLKDRYVCTASSKKQKNDHYYRVMCYDAALRCAVWSIKLMKEFTLGKEDHKAIQWCFYYHEQFILYNQ